MKAILVTVIACTLAYLGHLFIIKNNVNYDITARSMQDVTLSCPTDQVGMSVVLNGAANELFYIRQSDGVIFNRKDFTANFLNCTQVSAKMPVRLGNAAATKFRNMATVAYPEGL